MSELFVRLAEKDKGIGLTISRSPKIGVKPVSEEAAEGGRVKERPLCKGLSLWETDGREKPSEVEGRRGAIT